MPPVITIDGPSGSGKGTVARRLADRLGWQLLDSGALYRALAYAVLATDTAWDDAAAMRAVVASLSVQFFGREQHLFFQKVNINNKLRTEKCANLASQLAVLPLVRSLLLPLQQQCRQPPGLIADGRDMGTVVFPDAPLKLFLIADVTERARRRYKQLKEQGNDVKLADVESDLARRDARDKTRAIAPLVPATDAVIIDTNGIGVDQVLATIEPWLASFIEVR